LTWHKFNFVFLPNGHEDRNYSHSTVPTPLVLDRDRVRVYYSSRDICNRNRVYYVELEISDKVKVVDRCDDPVIDIGPPGYFDCDGIYATSLVKDINQLYFYYAGWNAGRDGFFYSNLGVAVSNDHGKTFRKLSRGPILGRDNVDPWACMAPFVQKLDDSTWLMWYTSGVRIWKDAEGRLKSLYDIKTANSEDGITWTKSGNTAIALEEETTNIARACVTKGDGGFRAWYPYVNKSNNGYRIGYAESADGAKFVRLDDSEFALIEPDAEIDWHSEEVTYPHVFDMDGRLFMLFNGNGYGQTGFGLAEWRDD